MPVRGAGLADWFGVSPVAVFRRHCRRHWRRHLAVCALVAGAIVGASPGAITGAIEGTISLFAHWLQAPLLAPLKAPFLGAIFWLQVSFPRRFRRASNTRLEASIKEKYRITTLVSRLSSSLIWIWNWNPLLRCPCSLCYLNNNFMKQKKKLFKS